MNEPELNGKIAVVTGGSRGIGAAAAEILSNNGAFVVVADIDLEGAKVSVANLERNNGKAAALHVDISDEVSVIRLKNSIEENIGVVDILINNAGILDPASIADIRIDDWERVLDVNLKGTFLCSKHFIESMIESKYGRIVNISSLAGQIGGIKAGPAYTASKAGIIGLTKSFARYAAAYGVNVNCICPGFIETEMTKGRDDPASVPLKRLGTPRDVAGAVYFLVSELSGYITGATIDVNGGLSMR